MNNELKNFLENYRKKALSRFEAFKLPPRPLNENEVNIIINALTEPNLDKKEFTIFETERIDKLLIRLLKEEVRRGTFPETYTKAKGLSKIITGEIKTDYINKKNALQILGNMKGGPATAELINLLEKEIFPEEIKNILKYTVLVNKKDFDKLTKITKNPNLNVSGLAHEIIKSWAKGEFAEYWNINDIYHGKAVKIGDNITTDNLSPSNRAHTRTDHPLHALYIMEGREDEADLWKRVNKINKEKESKENTILVAGKALGEGSSRKSATYSILQLIGTPIKEEPENKSGGIVIAKSFAPIFENSLVASGILPVKCNTDKIKEGDCLKLNIEEKTLSINEKEKLSVELPIQYKLNKISAGGMIYFEAGLNLQKWAKGWCDNENINVVPQKNIFKTSKLTSANTKESKPPQTLAQKITTMNRLDGKDYIHPGDTAPIKVRGVFSQDTTGPMTIEEYQKMAGEDFGTEFVVQSLCHTGECPSSEERDRHKFLTDFFKNRGGVSLAPGEGIIHTIGNRFVLPTDVIVGGDSHTRTPHGLSYPASSDIVAGAMKHGKIDLTMDKSVRVIFQGRPQEGITARDLVSTLVLYAKETGNPDIYNGRIIEMEGVSFLNSDERYILTNAAAERNASAATIPPDEVTLETIKNNLDYLKKRPDSESSISVKNNIEAIEKFLKNPLIPSADQNAEYEATIEIPLDEIKEPLVSRPHHPDNISRLSEVAGTKIDEVFIGSCVGGDIEGIRTAAKILKNKHISQRVHFVISPAALDIYNTLAEDGSLADLTKAGAIVIMPGCGLCMGNKRRIGSGSTAFTTTTRNYRSRIGPPDSKTYLGSANVAAITALLGEIPSKEEYFDYI
ncbi:bifunctional aconitate hydratase 2/2-methylisocitrate dehydratase [Natranaerofaba carboxydovora]|uniref:bifunctional aconitate hydratase 2/2-methylisocitrate dehydratase n=1 Tax=Natranaerofaba carboxydovora TaxID=2742683 RepID=UPI001F140FFF|nr:bifunctional aconitate hydratase 2/2-methylisocitrate dehydratase [Natranaerofaba carboxydovora]UMZ72741.1 Aconitate hydratase B [Natranaerofaba carboxydovora]